MIDTSHAPPRIGFAVAFLLMFAASPSLGQPAAKAADNHVEVECVSALDVASDNEGSCKAQFDRCIAACSKNEMGKKRRRCNLDCKQKASHCKSKTDSG